MRKLLLSIFISTAMALPMANAQQTTQSTTSAEQGGVISEESSLRSRDLRLEVTARLYIREISLATSIYDIPMLKPIRMTRVTDVLTFRT